MFQGPLFHITTVRCTREPALEYHTHDYFEIFWIVQGRCRHQINQEEQILRDGAVVLMRAEDAHCLRPASRSGFTFTNLALAPEISARLHRAYPDMFKRLYVESGRLPLTIQLKGSGRDQLEHQAATLAKSSHDVFHIERCVMEIWSLFLAGKRQSDTECPDWLIQACLRAEEPEVYRRGVPGLVEAAGRSHEHLAREARRWLGKTPSQIITEARLNRAAYELRLTRRSVTEIALDCGYDDPGQFFRVFKRHYRTTPRKYRSVT